MKLIIKHFYNRLNKLPIIAHIVRVLKDVPSASIYWYSFLIIGVLVIIVNVVLAVIVLPNTISRVQQEEREKKNTITINRDELNEVLDILIVRESEFRNAKVTVPNIVDPGR